MRYIECPELYRRKRKEKGLFLAGGITNCPQWQLVVVDLLKNTDLTVLNPRRAHFDVADSDIERKQIQWEFAHLEKATGIVFWFCAETLCPITLFEYGKWLVQDKPLFVGHHPGYERKNDLRIQTRLVRKRQKIHESLEGMAQEIISWANNRDFMTA